MRERWDEMWQQAKRTAMEATAVVVVAAVVC